MPEYREGVLEPEVKALWIGLGDTLHRRLRRLALSGFLLLAAATGDWLFRHEQLANEQARLSPQLDKRVLESSSGKEKSDFALEIERASTNPECLVAMEAPATGIRLQCLSSISTEARGAGDAGRGRKIYGQDVPELLYRLVLLFGPIVLLLATVVSVKQLRRVHSLLRTEVGNTSVQLQLNSPYFARVTTAYGQGWTSQIGIAAAISLVPIVVAFMYVPAVLMPRNAVSIVSGDIMGAVIVATGDASDALIALWLAVLMASLVLWIVVVVTFARVVAVTPDPAVEEGEGVA